MLELKNVSKRFGGIVATDEVTLDVKRGEVHALIGPNGAGKTTLIAQISGSLGSDGGAILFDGGASRKRRRFSTRRGPSQEKSGSPGARLRSLPRSRTASSVRSKWAWRSPPAPGSCFSTSRWRAWDRKNRKT